MPVKCPGVPSPPPQVHELQLEDADRRKLRVLLMEWGPAFGVGGCHVPCGPSVPRGRDRRGRQCQEVCVRTSLASGVTLTPVPQSCLLSALPSGVEGRAAESCPVLLRCLGAMATARQPEGRRRRGSNRAGGRSDCHASLPQNCPAWGHLHPQGGRKVFSRGG